ncbi:MAG: zf-HC2 domain-containing protein [Ruminococcus sp.]|nr:zf-HC2 domain-containing protein [Ruminococcus sp.]
MKYNCDMISDLIPLYIDNVCSQSSRQAIEEHLSECASCRKLCESMRGSNTVLDQNISRERDEVLVKQAKFFKRRSAIAGSIIGAVFALPILICLIVNLATGAGLTWFFIVLAAMFIPASLIIVPLMAYEDKFFWTIVSFTASLLLLLGVCCIYSGGSWFLTAAASVLFGLTLPFMPFIVTARPVAKRIGNNKGLLLVASYTVTYLLMMICIGLKNGSEDFFRIAAAYSISPMIFMWGLFALIRLPKWNGLLKAASCILFSAVVFFFSDTIVLLTYAGRTYIPELTFSTATPEKANGALCWSVLAAGVVLSFLFAIAGIIRSIKNNKKEISK